MKKKKNTSQSLKQTRALLEVVHQLRRECPWDRKQTHLSLTRYLLEESYEAIEAIEKKKWDSLKEELGDVLLQVVLHSEIAKEKNRFSFEEVAEAVCRKMIVRHPHVFPGKSKDPSLKIRSADQQTKNWSKIKAKENPSKGLLEGTPTSMPALALSQRYGEIAATVNFDWPNLDGVLAKLEEEVGELRQEIAKKKHHVPSLELELGDVLFVLTRVASHLKLDAERALKKSAAKFEKRFSHMEKAIRRSGKAPADLSLAEWGKYWDQAKL